MPNSASKNPRSAAGVDSAQNIKAPVEQSEQRAAALHAFGLTDLKEGEFEAAAIKFVRAIELGGPAPPYCRSLADALAGAGKVREAITCYKMAISLSRRDLTLRFALGRLLTSHGHHAEAVTVLNETVSIEPLSAHAWALLGCAMNLSGNPEQAVKALQHATKLDPENATFHYDCAIVRASVGDLTGAESSYRDALRLAPRFPEALNNLGNLLCRRGAITEAIPLFRKALKIRPDYVDSNYNLGLALQSVDFSHEAELCYQSVLEADKKHHAARNNYGNVLLEQGRLEEALKHYQSALSIVPDNREYRANFGMAQLLGGDFERGWENYDARQVPGLAGIPLWKGEPLQSRHIVLLAEQGLGDTIQFCRYARHLRSSGARVSIVCQELLRDLLRTVSGIEDVYPIGSPIPESDYYAPLLHLPAVLKTRLDTIPAEIPYIFTGESEWDSQLRLPNHPFRIGIAWRGGTEHRNDRKRSLLASLLEPLGDIPEITYVSLQKGVPEGCEYLPFTPLPRDLTDFADTAALISHLDLVISVDTSVAHLAGAMGHPTWLLLPFAPDWRWLRDRNDTPWYPSMRLFRQSHPGEWTPVLRRVRAALLERIAAQPETSPLTADKPPSDRL